MTPPEPLTRLPPGGAAASVRGGVLSLTKGSLPLRWDTPVS